MRRTIGIVALLGAIVSGCTTNDLDDVMAYVDDARVKARIGVVANAEVGWIKDTKTLEDVLKFYRDSKVKAVVFTGKVTKDGYKNQFEVLDQVWRKVFGSADVRKIAQDGKYEIEGFAFAVSSVRPLGKQEVPTFCGVERRALTDELCYYPRENNVIQAGSLNGVELQTGFVSTDKQQALFKKAAQGLLVSVYSDKVAIRRLNFVKGKRGGLVGEDVADPWMVGEPLVREPAPQFWDDVRIPVIVGMENGKPIYTVKWPNVQRRFTGARARFYMVEAVYLGQKDLPFLRRAVVSGGFFRQEEKDVDGVQCVFKASELPKRNDNHQTMLFGVTPIGGFGKPGKTFYSDPIPLPAS